MFNMTPHSLISLHDIDYNWFWFHSPYIDQSQSLWHVKHQSVRGSLQSAPSSAWGSIALTHYPAHGI